MCYSCSPLFQFLEKLCIFSLVLAKILALKMTIFQIFVPKIHHFSRKFQSLDPTFGNPCGTCTNQKSWGPTSGTCSHKMNVKSFLQLQLSQKIPLNRTWHTLKVTRITAHYNNLAICSVCSLRGSIHQSAECRPILVLMVQQIRTHHHDLKSLLTLLICTEVHIATKETVLHQNLCFPYNYSIFVAMSAITARVQVYISPGGLLKYDLGSDVPLRLEK